MLCPQKSLKNRRERKNVMKINPVFAVAVAGLALLAGCDKETPQVRTVPAVVVEPAVEMGFADSVTEIGEIQAYDTVALSANVSGFLTEANFVEGQLVKKGTKLFQIDPTVYEAAVNKAEAEVNKAKVKLRNANVEYERQKRLLSTKATSQSIYDTAEMNYLSAQAELKYAEATLAEKQVDLKYTKILAPFDGYIGFKNFSVGNMVGPSSGALARITAAGDAKVYFSIDELTMLKIFDNYPDSQTDVSASPKVKITLQNGREHKEKVRIAAWNNMVESGTCRIQAIACDSKQVLVPGQYVKVTVQVSPLKKRIMIKQAGLLREQLGTFVYVVDGQNKIERRKIVTGMKNGDYQVVISGIKAGERIVVDGLQKAGHGDKVRPITPQQTVPGKPLSVPSQESTAAKEAAPVQQNKNEVKK